MPTGNFFVVATFAISFSYIVLFLLFFFEIFIFEMDDIFLPKEKV